MGATTYTIKAKGNNVKDIFNLLVEEAEYHNGHDSYNGTISTTTLASKIELPKELVKGMKNDDWEILEKYDRLMYPRKWETTYSEEVTHYEAFTPTWFADKETPKREKGVTTLTQYAIMTKNNEEFSTRGAYTRLRTYGTLTDAKREAKALAIDSGKDVIIKQVRSNGDLFKVGKFILVSDNKIHKSARKTKTKTYLPVSEFTFYVYASC